MIPDTLPEYNENADSVMSSDFKILKGIIADLRTVIDQLHLNFANAKNLILELARRLDETKRYEQSEICRKIKKILEDKIKEGKITEKWITECLPQEYKRRYSKRELYSLSRNTNTKKLENIEIDNRGKTAVVSSAAVERESIDNNTNCIEPKRRNTKEIMRKKGLKELGVSENDNNNCVRCPELEEALRKASPLVPAEYIYANQIKFTIPKTKYEKVTVAMEISRDSIYLTFDKSGILQHADPDIWIEKLIND
jgi:hypothetical protein